ncbi:MAG TPA: ABC transporter permease [Bryobacteraceae bacterium]|jgi:predicted permease|nr:ABC transporter permease [Bryobacteraceae bacterium]
MSWRRFWQRKRRDDDLAREIESYLAHEADLLVSRGLHDDEAAWAAHRKLGNRTMVKEKVWEMNSLQLLESIWQDLRYAARLLRTNPGFFAVATISLALGIGANTAIFQLLDAVRLRMLPVENPQQLVELKIAPNDHCCNGNFVDRRPNFTSAQWEQIRSRQQAFSSIFAWGDEQFKLTQSGPARFAEGLWVTGDYFKTLGVKPLIGRLIDSSDDVPGCGSSGAVIGYSFWQQHYGGDSGVLGKTILLDGHPFNITGVTPPNFFGVEVGRSFDVVLPACAEPLVAGKEASNSLHRHYWWLAIIGRLKPGWTLSRAIAQVQTISPGVFENTVPEAYRPEQAKYYAKYRLTALSAGSGVSSLRNNYEQPLLLLLGIAGLVLLIACANLANLTLARASVREREMAVRLAIGAGRNRLMRQLLSESLLLTVCGTALGILIANAICRYMVKFLTTQRNPIYLALSPDWRLLGFTAAVAVLTCVLFGLTPAIRATRTAPAGAMKAAGRGLTADRERFSLRRALVVAQVAMSLVLLAGALLFVRSLHNLLTLHAGLQQNGLLIMGVDLSELHYPPERRAVVYRDLLDQVRATPGVDLAATANIVPISGSGWNEMIQIPGVKSQRDMIPWFNRVSTEYFRTVGTSLLAGRDFDRHDTVSSPEVAIVNQEFSRKFLDGANPIGRQILLVVGPGEPQHQYQIVGLVKDSKYQDLHEDFKPLVYVAQSQDKDPYQGINVLMRSAVGAGPLTAALTRAAAKADPGLSIAFQSFGAQVRDSLLRDRLMATLSAFFGFLAASLATVGLYGVISYMVARRRGEIGIRMALGATRGGVMRLILKEAAALLIGGLVLGTVLAIAASRAATTLLYGLKPTDPSTMVMAVGLLAFVAMFASVLPAHRASRTEPMAALREE